MILLRTSRRRAGVSAPRQLLGNGPSLAPCVTHVFPPDERRQGLVVKANAHYTHTHTHKPSCCSVTRQTRSCSSDYRAKVANARGQTGADNLAALCQESTTTTAAPPDLKVPNVQVCDTESATASTRLATGPDSCPCRVLTCPNYPLTSNQKLISRNARGKSESTSSCGVG